MKGFFSEKRNLSNRSTIGVLVILVLAAAFFVSGCVGNNSDKTSVSVSSPFKDSIIGTWARSDSDGLAAMQFDKAGMVKLVIKPTGKEISSMTGVYHFIDSDRMEMTFSIRDDPGYLSRTYKVISTSGDVLVMKDEKKGVGITLKRMNLEQ